MRVKQSQSSESVVKKIRRQTRRIIVDEEVIWSILEHP